MVADKLPPLLPEEKPNRTALILSAAVHLILVGALFFGVQWRSQTPSSVAVEVWSSAPPPVAETRPEPVPEPPPPPKPEPKPEPKPQPKVEPPPPPKPDIAVKEEKKPKKPEPPKEEPKKPEPKKPEPKKPETKKEPDWAKDLAKELEREQKQIDRQKAATREAQERSARADAERQLQDKLRAEQAASTRRAAGDKYQAAIAGKIRGHIVLPPSIQGNPEAIFEVTQLPTGEILPPVRVVKSSGNRLLDEAIERAILKSSPLPKPDDPSLFDRKLRIPYRPFEE